MKLKVRDSPSQKNEEFGNWKIVPLSGTICWLVEDKGSAEVAQWSSVKVCSLFFLIHMISVLIEPNDHYTCWGGELT